MTSQSYKKLHLLTAISNWARVNCIEYDDLMQLYNTKDYWYLAPYNDPSKKIVFKGIPYKKMTGKAEAITLGGILEELDETKSV